ncbi:hypothetical protein SLI_5376 [Streptomyces lividans 1326]|uniref:Uncharacterized protein n=1 Tax=Streptomyces lividans 1326 TaxID=1200984 RepID=A0A7U9DTY5_STRLI|nr:hypothetical protein SLI_5376 [Streptomyces lividans 1326]
MPPLRSVRTLGVLPLGPRRWRYRHEYRAPVQEGGAATGAASRIVSAVRAGGGARVAGAPGVTASTTV